MTTTELKEIVEIANKGVFKKFVANDITDFIEEDGYFSYLQDCYHINEILFCEEFGKAYWKDHKIHDYIKYGTTEPCLGEIIQIEVVYAGQKLKQLASKCSKCEQEYLCDMGVVAYKYHQSKLGGLSHAERLDYMVNDLKMRKEKG